MSTGPWAYKDAMEAKDAKKVSDMFKVYAQTRATRQLAGDVAESLDINDPARYEWQKIEAMLEDVEGRLEQIRLK